MRRWPILASFLLVVCSSASMGPVSVPMSYKTMASPADFPSAQSCAALSRIDARDNRSDNTLGKRYQQESTATTYPVTTTSDVAEWIRSGATAALQKANVNVSGHGPPVQLRRDQITVSESGHRGAHFNGW